MKTWRILEKRVTWIIAALSIPLAPAIVVMAVHVPLEAGAGKYQTPAGTSGPASDGIGEMISVLESVPERRWRVFFRGQEPRIWGAPELSPVMECMVEKLRPVAERFRETAVRGPLDPARTDGRMSAPARSRKSVPGIMLSERVSAMSQMVLSTGWAQLADGNQDRAMARAVESVALFSPVAWTSPYLMMERGWHALALFETVLRENPDTTVSKQALEHLHKLRIPTNTGLLAAPLFSRRSMFPEESGQDPAPLQTGLIMTWQVLVHAASALSQESGLMTRPENKRWAESLKQVDGSSFNSYAGISAFLPWTRIPALESHLRHVVESEPKLRWRHNADEVLAAGVDPFTAALRLYSQVAQSGQGDDLMLRQLLTSRNALMTGFAAQIHRSETGQWPSSVEDLVSAYGNLPLPSAPGTMPIEQMPLGTVEPYPVRIERAGIRDDLVAGMLMRSRSRPEVSLTAINVPPNLASEGAAIYEGRVVWRDGGDIHALTAFEDIDSWKASLGNRLREATVVLETDQTSRTITREEAVESALRRLAIPDDLCPGMAGKGRRVPLQVNRDERVVIIFRLELPRTLFTIKYGSHAMALVQGAL